ncbi:MAG: hypothetical protein DRP42_01275 [Tenericutes bacterium]|nr:MAG: hypothetical protein DRP42_01275 [Mycoplasmatota bacterium]
MKTFSNKIEHEYERLDTHISQVIEKYSVIKDLTKEQKILIKSAINNIKKSFGKNAIKLNDYSFHKARVSVDKKDINIDLKFAVITVTENS